MDAMKERETMPRKIGLAMMLLPFVFLIIFAATHGLNEYYDLTSNLGVALIQGMPCIFVAAVSWLWPRRGGVAALVMSLLLLTLSVSMVLTSKVPPPGQVYPVLSLAEIATYILPYVVLFLGSILAFVSASINKVAGPNWMLKLRAGGVSKLRATLLIMISTLIVVTILFFSIAILTGGDSGATANLFTGLMMGLTFATPLLILFIIVAAWRRNLLDGSVVCE